MLSFNDIRDLIANNFFDGSSDLAGMVMYGAILIVVVAMTKGNMFFALIIGMVVTLFFSAVGILSTELTVLLIIVSVLGLAFTSRRIWE